MDMQIIAASQQLLIKVKIMNWFLKDLQNISEKCLGEFDHKFTMKFINLTFF